MASNDAILAEIQQLRQELATRPQCSIGLTPDDVAELHQWIRFYRHMRDRAGDVVVSTIIIGILALIALGAVAKLK